MKFLAALSSLAAIAHCSAFSVGQTDARSASVKLQATSEDASDTRRDFFGKAGAAALSIASSSGLGLGVLAPSPANAVGGVSKVSQELKA